ncbi:MAG: MoxR family ATPase [Candidatus Thermoplasmatota archaeon]|nr:MoxR family ATPase [Candidatus Thermoplasmatota archaeon]MEC7349745.1 MoxR family ATPase [Candidatus Thermoplasmatota archaeon]MEC7493959.1 MoxR family ATPase [Candidatus Thermoplasmatota archaeon]MEC8073414.1 MoxR family ATPase [Candidatus Thermoplasmatota archaeon]
MMDPSLQETHDLMQAVLAEAEQVVMGKRPILDLTAVGILAGGNILFEDNPGLAKTLLANTFAQALGIDFKRVQFTPDLLPADITGIYIWNQKDQKFEFRKGPLFCNLLLADEINRAPPKTQAALLEAMQEHQVTIEGETHVLPEPFVTLATQNPIESEGTYPLPDAQLDRFMMKLSMGYPGRPIERAILVKRKQRGKDDHTLKAITTPEKLREMQLSLEKVRIDDSIIEYIVEIIYRTREDPRVKVGSSPRGAQSLFKLSRALAVLSGRDYVIPDDIKRLSIYTLRHRIILKPEPRIKGVKTEEIVSEILEQVEVPTTQGQLEN